MGIMAQDPRPVSNLWGMIAAGVLVVCFVAFVPVATCPSCKGSGTWEFSDSGAAIGCARRVSLLAWWGDRTGSRFHQAPWR